MKFFIKYIASLFLATSAFAAEDGWFPVEPAAKSSFEKGKEDPSIWVVFRKGIGSEQFLVRFPEEPIYQMVEGRFQARSLRDGEEFLLTVLPREGGTSPTDRTYQADGKWVSEQVRVTEEHVYLFRTISDQAQSPTHSYFCNSFLVQKN